MLDEFAERALADMEGNDQPVDPRIMRERLLSAAEPIVQRLESLAQDVVKKRVDIERRWLEDMCHFAGVRDVSELRSSATKSQPFGSETRKTAGSTVFVNITRPKTNRIEGRLFDILFPADDRNWGIRETPVPSLAMVAQRAVEEARNAVDEANRARAGEQTPSGMSEEELVNKAGDLGTQGAQANEALTEAKSRASRMSDQIADDLVQCNYAQKCRDAISWACKIGIGVLKGPVVCDGGRKWQQGENGYALQMGSEHGQPGVDTVSPWHFFPDPSATSMDDAEYVFERHLVSRRDLRKLARELGFDPKAVNDILRDDVTGVSGTELQFLSDIRLLTGETTPVKDRYVVWEYHGLLTREETGHLIRAFGGEKADERVGRIEAGRDGEELDPRDDIMVKAWICQGKLLKMSEHYPLDSGELCYSVFSFEKGNASILGAIGQPRIMRDAQTVLNAAWRMMMDNARLSVAPQVVIDKAAVQPANGDWTMQPGKEWLFDKSNAGQVSPFQVFNITMNQEQIAGIIALAKQFIDDETAMPSIIEGGGSEERAPGAASTVGGFAMMLNAAGVNTRRIVKNWDDDVTTPMIRRVYDYEMQHSPREEIKGDMQVEARGTSVLLAREMQAPNLSVIATQWSTHPVLGPMLQPHRMASLTLQSLAIDPKDVLVTEDEYKKFQADQAAAAQDGPAVDPQWETRLQIAQIQADSDKERIAAEREIAILKLSETSKLSITQIQADLEKTRITTQSNERKLTAEIGADRLAAQEATNRGELPPNSGGAVSFGADRKAGAGA